MRPPRHPRSLLLPLSCALLLIWPLVWAACSGQRTDPSRGPVPTQTDSGERIRAGGGATAEMAQRLLRGDLPTAQPEVMELADDETMEEFQLESAMEVQAPSARLSAEEPAATVRERAFDSNNMNQAVGLGGGAGGAYGGRAGRRPVANPRSANADAKAGSAVAQQRWQRTDKTPRFARVYVGDGNSLELRRMRVTTRIEGARARTLVDHVFFNPHDRPLEGTFEYALPTGASPVYYGMFLGPQQRETPDFFAEASRQSTTPERLLQLAPQAAVQLMQQGETGWGELREARVVGKVKARQVYEQIVRQKIDPALLEWESGNTFRGRVFPIGAGSFHRVIVAYEQPVDALGDGTLEYRFPLPGVAMELCDVSVQVVGGEVLAAEPERAAVLGAGSRRWAWESGKVPGTDVAVRYPAGGSTLQAIAGRGPDGVMAFHARFAPELPMEVDAPWADRAVFLLDTSLSEQPDRFQANLALWQRILERDQGIQWFQVMTFDVGAGWPMPGGWLRNDAATRRAMRDTLEGLLLAGGTDMGVAVDALSSASLDGRRLPTWLFLLSDGQLTWGDRDPARMAGALHNAQGFDFRVFCYRTGLGAENLGLFRELTRRGGAICNVFTVEQAEEAALAHRRPVWRLDEVKVVDAAGTPVPELLLAGRQAAIHPGGELLLAGRAHTLQGLQLVVTGDLNGQSHSTVTPMQFPVADGQLAPRAFAELLVHQILALRRPDLEPLAVAYAQAWRIVSRVSSFLVLETDAEYEQYEVAKEAAAAELPTDGISRWLQQRHGERSGPVSPATELRSFLAQQLDKEVLDQKHVAALLATLQDADCEIPKGFNPGSARPRSSRDAAAAALLHAVQGYLAGRDRKVQPFLQASEQAFAQEASGAGLRALSSIPELHPGHSDGLRTVGYRLLAAGLPEAACAVFDAVRRQRPFEPQAWRDLGRALGRAGRFPLAALCNEIVLAGKWDGRFGEHLTTVVRSEYLHLLRRAMASDGLDSGFKGHFSQRIEELAAGEEPADLRVTISWNTDSTDVDLWIVEPTGEACGYSHKETAAGGRLLDDLTGGFGPERYQIVTAPQGAFHVLVHLYSGNNNLLAQETQVDVQVTVDAGMDTQQSKSFTVALDEQQRAVEVCIVDPKGGSSDMGLGRMEDLPEGVDRQGESRASVEGPR